jgi:hypothetical protein
VYHGPTVTEVLIRVKKLVNIPGIEHDGIYNEARDRAQK